MTSKSDQVKALQELTSWSAPSAGGWYDDLGELDAPHYVSNIATETGDQALGPSVTLRVTSVSDQYYQVNSFDPSKSRAPPALKNSTMRSQMTFVSTTKCLPSDRALPIQLLYADLPPDTVYTMSVTGSDIDHDTTLTANGVGGIKPTDGSHEKKVFAIPAAATAIGGDLLLQFSSPTGLTLAEAWLEREA